MLFLCMYGIFMVIIGVYSIFISVIRIYPICIENVTEKAIFSIFVLHLLWLSESIDVKYQNLSNFCRESRGNDGIFMVVYQSIFMVAGDTIFSFSLYLWCIYCDYRSLLMSNIRIYPILIVRVGVTMEYLW